MNKESSIFINASVIWRSVTVYGEYEAQGQGVNST